MIKIYTQEEASKLLFPGLTPKQAKSKLSSARNQKKISFRKDGHSISFTESDILDYLENIKRPMVERTNKLDVQNKTSINKPSNYKPISSESLHRMAQDLFKPKTRGS